METSSRRVASLSLSSGLHAALLGVLVFASLQSLDQSPSSRVVAVVTLPPAPEPTLADTIADLSKRDAAGEGGDDLDLPGGAIDIARIRARQHDLFPLLTDGVPALTGARDKVLVWFDDAAPAGDDRSLTLSDAALNRVVDRAWSRRDRWRSFVEIATLISAHDPDTGQSAQLVRAHIERNLLQPYDLHLQPETIFWGLLGLAVDQRPFIEFIERFVREHPRSRTATELLFLLDALAEANRSTLLVLFWTEPRRDLPVTREVDPGAYDLAVAIRGRYMDILERRSLASAAGIEGFYDDIRARILTTILETTPDGYGAADARYLLGRIRWAQERRAEAIDIWRLIEPDARGVYAPFYDRITPEVLASSSNAYGRISAALGAHRIAWQRDSRARLKQFGLTSTDY